MPDGCLHKIDDIQAEPSGPLAGIGVAVTSLARRQLHVGIIHRGFSGPAHIVHLQWHLNVANDELPCQWPRAGEILWAPLRMDPERINQIAFYCRAVARGKARIPYGAHYEGGTLTVDGAPRFIGREDGFTCATFALALLRGAGIELLDLSSWKSRGSDQRWLDKIVDLLRKTKADTSRIAVVTSQTGSARYRPEEVVAGAMFPEWPVPFDDAEAGGKLIAFGMLTKAKQKGRTHSPPNY